MGLGFEHPRDPKATMVVGRTSIPCAVFLMGFTLWALACGGDGGTTAPPPLPPPPPNQAPVAVGSIPSQTVTAGETVTLGVASYFNDPDGDALTYTVATSNAGIASPTISGSTMTIAGVSAGTATITVTARDPGGLAATQSTSVTVERVNQRPVAVGTISPFTVLIGETLTVALSGYFSDPDGDELAYAVSTSDAAVASPTVSGTTMTIAAIGVGTARITVEARDPSGLSAEQSTTVTVEQPNRRPTPVGTISGQTVEVGDSVTVDMSAYFNDPDGDTLRYNAASPNARVATVSVSGSTVTVSGVAVGSATITVTATDPEGLSATQQFVVTVSTGNRQPVVVARIPAQTMTVGAHATVDASSYFSDPDGDVLTYGAGSSDAAVVGVSVSGSQLSVTGVAAGSATVTVTATDPGGLSATQQFVVTVSTGNRPPTTVGTIPDQAITVGATTTVDVSSYFSDPDGDVLTYGASSSDVAVARVSVSGSQVSITGVAAGSVTVTVTASDLGGLSATQQFVVTVRTGNRSPTTVGTIPDQAITVGATTTVNVSSYFSDPDGDVLTYAASSSDAAVASVSVSGSTVSVTGVAAGSATVTVTATDPGNRVAVQTFNASVAENQDRAVLATLYNATDGPNWDNSDNWLTDAPLEDWYGVKVDSNGRVRWLRLRDNNLTGPIPPELGNLSKLDTLELHYNSLTGPIPPQLANLTALKSLVLGSNSLTGPIPAELTTLANLSHLSLFFNDLTGSIPPELANLTKLTSLNLSGSGLTGPVPRELAKLANLSFLWLYGSDLTGPVPPELGNLTALEVLDLSDNSLTGPIPPELGTLTALRNLNLRDNNLTGSIPSELGDLSRLEGLSLARNNLTGSIPSELGDLSRLEGLSLAHNNLTGSIPSELGDLSRLGGLSLAHNNLTGSIPPELGNRTGLVVVYLNNNNLAGPIPLELANLIKLELFWYFNTSLCVPNYNSFRTWLNNIPDHRGTGVDCQVTTNRAPVTVGAIPAQSVNVEATITFDASQYFSDPDGDVLTYTAVSSDNGVASVSASGSSVTVTGVAAGTATVTVEASDPAGLSASQTASITVAGSVSVCDRTEAIRDEIVRVTRRANCTAVTATDLANVERLDIGLFGEKVTELKEGDFAGLSGLLQLDLSHNELVDLPGAIFNGLSRLETLDLRYNDLASLPEAVFAGLSSLNALDLSENEITEVPGGIFAGIGNLQTLSLNSNDLFTLPENAFRGLSSLEGLNLGGNDLAVLPTTVFSSLSVLKELHLGANELGPSIPLELFADLSSLEELSLASNEISSLRVGVFAGLSSLETLWLGSNELTMLPGGIFNGLSSIRQLFLSSNDLASLPENIFARLTRLEWLSLSINKLATLPEDIFAGLTRLEWLELDSNQLVTLPEGVFAGLARLEKLDLYDNNLATLPKDIFAGLASLSTLRMPFNNLTTLPEGIFAELAGLETLVLNNNEIATLPEGIFIGLTSLTWLDLSDNPGAPFEFTLGFERTNGSLAAAPPATVRLVLAEGAPFTMAVPLSVEGGTASPNVATLPAGSGEGPTFSVTPSASGQTVRVSASSLPRIPNLYYGIELKTPEPIVLFASGSAVEIAGVEPATLVEGSTATITGSGFSSIASNNEVAIGGLAATVTSATETALTIRVPRGDCLPPRRNQLRVAVGGQSDELTVGVSPRSKKDLDLPQYYYRYTTAGHGCLHLPGSTSGGEFLIGVTSVSEDAASLTSVSLAATAGDASVASAATHGTGAWASEADTERTRPLGSGPVVPRTTEPNVRLADLMGDADTLPRRNAEAHNDVMERNLALVRRLGRATTADRNRIAAARARSLEVGDMLTLYAERGATCAESEQVTALVRLVGQNAVWLEDVDNPSGTFTDSELSNLDDFYTANVQRVHDSYFGQLSDIDGNGRILILMTKQVNRIDNLAGWVSFRDLYSRQSCATSNEAEIFYGQVPDPFGSFGKARTKQSLLKYYPNLLTHEITHLIQGGALVFGNSAGTDSWQLEGGATLAEQLVAYRLFGHRSGENLGWIEYEQGRYWYWNAWVADLLGFFGWDQDDGRVRNAPEQCSWIGRPSEGNDGPCRGAYSAVYGVPSMIFRFAMDRWGDDYPGGESALMRHLTQSPKRGLASLEEVSSWRVEGILADFYTALWADGRVYNAFGMSTWDLYDIVRRYPASRHLQPHATSSTEPKIAARIRAGSSMYLHWTPTGALSPTSIRVTAPTGDVPENIFVWALRLR